MEDGQTRNILLNLEDGRQDGPVDKLEKRSLES